MTQGFDGNHPFEPAGFLAEDARGPRRARKTKFANSVARARLHGGIDIKCDVGTRIVAPERGRIVKADHYDLGNGIIEKYTMLQVRPGTILFFTHLDKHIAHEGDEVERGDPIAESGNSGHSTGPHLHWEVRVTRRKHPRPAKSGRWFKLNPLRLQEGGDLAGLPAIQPLPKGVEVATEEPAPPVGGGGAPGGGIGEAGAGDAVGSVADPDGDLESDDELDEDLDADDAFGDAAFAEEVAAGFVHPIGAVGGPLEF